MTKGCAAPDSIASRRADSSHVYKVVGLEQNAQPAPGNDQVYGTGWYPNIEVDDTGGIHLAWTNAEYGDVMYARWDPEAHRTRDVQVVEREGAAGSFLKLALGPKGEPILAYYNQTTHQLRLAHRPKDWRTKALESKLDKVENESVDFEIQQRGNAQKKETRQLSKKSSNTSKVKKAKGKPSGTNAVESFLEAQKNAREVKSDHEPPMGEGWLGENVAYGEFVGIGTSLVIDSEGSPHILFYHPDAKHGDRLRYARRHRNMEGFSEEHLGRFKVLTLDEDLGASHKIQTGFWVGSDEVIASYAAWQGINIELRLAIVDLKSDSVQVIEPKRKKEVDGYTSTLSVHDNTIDVYSVVSGASALAHFQLNRENPVIPMERKTLLSRPGPTSITRLAKGETFILTWGHGDTRNEGPGLWLLKSTSYNAPLEKVVLDEGKLEEPWLDTASRDGVLWAVWTSPDMHSMKLYRHK